MKSYRNILSEQQKKSLVDLIKASELLTSCEIKIHLNDSCPGDVLTKASELLVSLGLKKTKSRNGIILYLAVKDKKFAIAGDEGIYAKLPHEFWTQTNQQAINFFKDEKYFEGLKYSIENITHTLKGDFPAQVNNENELSNEISYE